MAKKKNNFLLIGLILILVLAIGFSYGYYLLNKVQENNNIVGSKCFNLEFTNEKNAINLDNMYPISDEEGRKLTPYSFTITNTCDMLAGYTVNMEMLEGTTLNSKYLDVMVNNEQIKLLTNYESTNTVIAGSTESRILAKGTLAYNDSVDYTVRFWMDKDVEDMESMNKLFKSKIVISATPSSWNPKDAGYDNLHDAILANEYQTTPEDAVKRLEAKGTPDFSQTAPIIEWQEKKSNILTVKNNYMPHPSLIGNKNVGGENLNSNSSKIMLGTSYTFDNSTAKYTLNNTKLYSKEDIENMDIKEKKYFTCDNGTDTTKNGVLSSYNRVSCNTMYKIESIIISDYGTVNTGQYRLNFSMNAYEYTHEEFESNKSDKGLYLTTDDYGNTYYYRGNVSNNNVYFANIYWKIIRVNGDNTIRLIYNGFKQNSSSSDSVIGFSKFNELGNNPAYVGYKYGDSNGEIGTIEKNNYNGVNSSIKLVVEKFYEKYILNNNLNKYISDSGFCGDRTLYSGDGVSTVNNSYYSALNRVSILKQPTLSCLNKKQDLYTIDDSNGNGVLLYPIGLITGDEIMMAGYGFEKYNTLNYLYIAKEFYSMTPSIYYGGGINNAYVTCIDWTGFFKNCTVGYTNGVRPVINLKSDVKITGGIGTANDPFVVDTNN